MESWKTDEKKRDEIKSEERRCNGAKVRRKKIHPRQMLEKSEVAKCYVFRASGESKSRLVKAAGAESCMWSEEKSKIARRCGLKRVFRWTCTKHVSFGPLFEVQMSKNYTPLWREEHVSLGHFLKFRCRKIARGCGEKHVSKCFGELFEVQMSKI